ncbi:MAG: arginase family protein, partial [Desulfohalobiaceae bacterium]|nr:arginase family protein [Desulfohalobiaceae bacterium]
RAIRNASMFYNYEGEQTRFYDSDRRTWMLVGKKIADGGDVNIEPLSLQRNFSYITKAVDSITTTGAVPAVVGGDHSITPPILRSFQKQDVHYVHFDTHIDCDGFFNSKYTHGSPVRRVVEENLAETVTLMGIRGLSNPGKDVVWLEKMKGRVITARELRYNPPDHEYFPLGNYYISLDIDFFDPGTAPATGTPEPGGLFFHEFSDVVHSIARKGKILGFDVVEVNPLLEGQAGITSHLAARCVLELLSAALDGSPST